MTKQPLHEACDKIYNVCENLLTIANDLDNNKLLTVNRKVQKANSELSRLLTQIRNAALKYEGNFEEIEK